MAETSFEVKFGQLADSLVHERAPILAPYKVGFQLIEKDEDETRGVGVLAYNMDKQWLYVPVFWLAGTIKGHTLLYIKNTDMFVPLSESWVNYLKSKQPFSMGTPSDKAGEYSHSNKQGSPGSVNISTLGNFFNGGKVAHDLNLVSADTIIHMRATEKNPKRIDLQEWMPLFGKEAASSFILTLQKKPDFANAMMTFYGPDELTNLVTPAFEKKANATVEEVTIITTKDTDKIKDLTEDEKETVLKEDVLIKDSRTNTSKVFEDIIDSKTLETPRKTGIYEVLLSDGSFKTFGVIIPDQIVENNRIYKSNRTFRINDSTAFLIDPNKGKGVVRSTSLSDILAKQTNPTATQERQQIRRLGKAVTIDALLKSDCLLIDESGKALEIGYSGRQIKGRNGQIQVVVGGYKDTFTIIPTHKNGKLILNRGVLYLPQNARLFEMTCSAQDNEYALGSGNTVLNGMLKEGMQYIKIFSDGLQYAINSDKKQDRGLNKLAALNTLVKDHGIQGDMAQQLLKSVTTDNYKPLSKRYLIKYAEDQFELDSNVNGDDYEQKEEKISTSQPKAMDEQTVQQVQQAAKSGVKEILDVTVISSLAKKSKSLDIVDDYLSDLVKSLDRVGRLLFLFYWHNKDFKNRYGKQEMYDLEISLKDVMESTSDLVLFLKERTIHSNSVLDNAAGTLSENIGNA